jgi:hypothetical protein
MGESPPATPQIASNFNGCALPNATRRAVRPSVQEIRKNPFLQRRAILPFEQATEHYMFPLVVVRIERSDTLRSSGVLEKRGRFHARIPITYF